MVSISFALDQIKKDPSQILSCLAICSVCQDLGVCFRDRVLCPVRTVHLFIGQIIHGNLSCAGVRHLGGNKFTAQAYCNARKRLPLKVLEKLSRRLCDSVRQMRESDPKFAAHDLFLTHRVFVLDGSNLSMPDTPELQKAFGQSGSQKKGCGFPVAHLLAMFDVNTGMLSEIVASPMRTHDLAKAALLHPRMAEGDLLLGDTAFGSYAHFAQLLQAKLHGLMPAHQQRIVDFTPNRRFVMPGNTDEQSKGLPRSRWIKSLGKYDQLVEWFKPPKGPSYMTRADYKALPESITVRELRRMVYRPELNHVVELTIVTTLLDDEKYPAEKLVELRLRRWQVEVNLRHLKTTMGMEVLKCKTVDGIRKELAVFGLVYNLVRMIMLKAAERQKVHPDRISFIDVLNWLAVAQPSQPMPRFIINKRRTGRIEPRVKKRRPKSFPLMRQTRQNLRNALKNPDKKPKAA
jgi:Transposase DDE domain